MNPKVKEAIDALCRLPEHEQEQIAELLLLEIETAAKWDDSFEKSKPQLERMAKEALAEYRAGESEPLDPDKI